MPVMNIELTPEQQEALDHQARTPQRVIDPRTHTAYVLVPESEYEMMHELLEDERREQAIHAVALRNAADRLDEVP
jgi:PHD/YefM family antitoxin component YafN of YafNO toxin-antitoxin module